MALGQRFNLYIKYIFRGFKNDSIRFNVITDIDYSEDPDGIPCKHTDIIINNKSLLELLLNHEVGEASRTHTNKNLAGNYYGKDPSDLKKVLKSSNKSTISLVNCSICNSSTCAANLICNYKKSLFSVTISEFRQISNTLPINAGDEHCETLEKCKWNYSAFGPYKFNRTVFFRELTKIA